MTHRDFNENLDEIMYKNDNAKSGHKTGGWNFRRGFLCKPRYSAHYSAYQKLHVIFTQYNVIQY